jgi:hypothetical protein
MGRVTAEYRSSNSTCSGDETAKMVRAEKEGATIGPTHGSRRRHKTSTDIVGKRTKGLK